jgi:hypothetical protein
MKMSDEQLMLVLQSFVVRLIAADLQSIAQHEGICAAQQLNGNAGGQSEAFRAAIGNLRRVINKMPAYYKELISRRICQEVSFIGK